MKCTYYRGVAAGLKAREEPCGERTLKQDSTKLGKRALRPGNELFNGLEVLAHPLHHQVIVIGVRNDEDALVLGSHVLEEVFALFERNQAVAFAVDDEGGKRDGADLRQVGEAEILDGEVVPGEAEPRHQPHSAGKTALD